MAILNYSGALTDTPVVIGSASGSYLKATIYLTGPEKAGVEIGFNTSTVTPPTNFKVYFNTDDLVIFPGNTAWARRRANTSDSTTLTVVGQS